LNGHTDWVLSLAVLSDNTLASSYEDRTIKIWDTTSGKELKTLSDHIRCVTSLAVLPDNTLASGSSDQTIKIWK
jgi:WD40 repeat protein